MRLTIRLAILSGIGSLACLAQTWEIGGAGGGTILTGLNANGPAGTATAGFQPGIAAGFVFGQNLYPRLTGELRYTDLQDDLKLSRAARRRPLAPRACRPLRLAVALRNA